MAAKLTIIKVTADGEQCSVEYHISPEEIRLHRAGKQHLRESVAPLFDLMDARLLVMNSRIMAANYLVQKLTPEARLAVDNVMDILHGKTQGPPVEKVLAAARAEVDEARAKGEKELVEVKDAAGAPTGRRKRPEPVAQGAEGGPEGMAVSLEDLQARLGELPIEAS